VNFAKERGLYYEQDKLGNVIIIGEATPGYENVEPVMMPLRFVAEMFCDRLAASKIYNKENYNNTQPLDYFLKGKDRRTIHPQTSDLLESWLVLLKEQGEDAVFKTIKTALRENK
jgi:hypothetical protein